MLAEPIQAPPPGALQWLQGAIAGASPVLFVLWRWWEKVRKKLDVAEAAAIESARQFQALHRNVNGLSKELGAIRERMVVLEDRSDREERERVATPVHGVRTLDAPERRSGERRSGRDRRRDATRTYRTQIDGSELETTPDEAAPDQEIDDHKGSDKP